VARIQHLAIASQDPEKQPAFYKDVFGFEEIRRIDNPRARGVILTDGTSRSNTSSATSLNSISATTPAPSSG
jgi:catechol 2,3-dioxygenase-like lactoylglutathione lyase family enzyme